MATIKELAVECDVSIATVSNVLNGTGRVGAETTEKVLAAAKRMGYVPNMLAKNLKQQNQQTIGVITEDLTVFNTADIVDGINAHLETVNYTFLLGNLRLFKKYGNDMYHKENYVQQVKNEFKVMLGQQVSGVIYVGAHSREIHCIPKDYPVPIVMAYSYTGDQETPAIVFDDEQGAYDAAMELIGQGHQKLGVITGDPLSHHTTDRMRGFCRALSEKELPYEEAYTIKGDWSRESGYCAMKQLWEKGIQAVFCMSDIMAAGVYDFAQEQGIKVGTDIAMIGFDNRQIAEIFNPGLTTMALPLWEIGMEAAKRVVACIERPDEKKPQLCQLKCKMIKRDSDKIVDKI